MALSLAPKSLQESYRSAKEVLLVEWNGSLNKGDGQNAGAEFTVKRLLKSSKKIKPDQKIIICDAIPGEDGIHIFQPRTWERYVVFADDEKDCLRLSFSTLSVVAIPDGAMMISTNFYRKPPAQSSALFFKKLSRLSRTNVNAPQKK